MKQFDNETLDTLLSTLMVSMSEEEKTRLKAESTHFFEMNALLDNVDTTGVTPMSYPFEDQGGVLRHDDTIDTLDHGSALLNAPHKKDGYIETVQVVVK